MIILGIGCNIGDRLANLRSALTHLRVIDELTIHQVSPVYESDALLPDNAPQNWDNPYLNLALTASTKLNPEQLFTKVKAIEEKMGRVARHHHWSPRIIDIDILAWHEERYHTDKLKIPHKGLLERPFALWPLADVAPDWKYCESNESATGKTAKELIKQFGSRFDGSAPLHTKQIAHRVDTPMMIGVLNITTDSFSDGGKFIDLDAALMQTENLFESGADIIDIGAESTRPGAITLTPETEWLRLQPILDAWQAMWLHKNFRPKISIDTRKPETAEKLLAYKIDFFNDVTGLTDPKMLEIIKASKAKIIFMHNLGIPANSEVVLSQDADSVRVVYQWGMQQLEKLINLGIDKERLIFDVGIGFGKSAEQSFAIIKNISQFHQLSVPLLVGHSRKSFFNQFTNKPFAKRDIETAAVSGFLATQKVEYLRVHNVDQNMRLLKINAALL
jgi:2-amino-4-hydroxy-6-hydroxymethyldihydropteridine diphosphokinase/dihydropteroate synthase